MNRYIKFLMSTLFVPLNAYSTSSVEQNKENTCPADRARFFITDYDAPFFSALLKRGPLPKVKKLILTVWVEGLEQLNAPNLQELALYSLQLSSWDILKIKAFRNLRSLRFRSASIPKTSEERIFFPYLKSLCINDNSLHDFSAFQKWDAPSLKELSLSRHMELQSFKGIDPFLKTLSSLGFTNMEIHSFKGLINKALPHFSTLELTCRLSEQALKELGELDLKNLQKLELAITLKVDSKHPAQNRGASYEHPKDLTCFPALNLPNVVYLEIGTVKNLEGLEKFHMPKLKILDLRHCEVSSTQIQKIQRVLGPKVKILKPIKSPAVRTL
jgi:hypothetical protein